MTIAAADSDHDEGRAQLRAGAELGSPDAVRRGEQRNRGYLVALDSRTLKPCPHVRLKDSKSGQDAWFKDDGSATPTIGLDGDVYYGVLENPTGENHYRGWMLHFDSSLAQSKTPGRFRMGRHVVGGAVVHGSVLQR